MVGGYVAEELLVPGAPRRRTYVVAGRLGQHVTEHLVQLATWNALRRVLLPLAANCGSVVRHAWINASQEASNTWRWGFQPVTS